MIVTSKELDSLWPTIHATVQDCEESLQEEIMTAIMDEVGTKMGAITDVPDLIAVCPALASPVAPDQVAAGAPTRRVLKAQTTNESEDSLDDAMLACLMLEPSSSKCSRVDVASCIPAKTKQDIQVIADIVFHKKSTVSRMRHAHKVYVAGQANSWFRSVFGAKRFEAVVEESEKWLANAISANDEWACKAGKAREVQAAVKLMKTIRTHLPLKGILL